MEEKKKISILCVEDGSVDIDDLENLEDGKVLIYRQGSKPPFVLELYEPKLISTPVITEDKWQKLKDKLLEYDKHSYLPKIILAFMKELEVTI